MVGETPTPVTNHAGSGREVKAALVHSVVDIGSNPIYQQSYGGVPKWL